MLHSGTYLLEGILIEKQVKSLDGMKLSLGMLLLQIIVHDVHNIILLSLPSITEKPEVRI
jgi:hypothetical protein